MHITMNEIINSNKWLTRYGASVVLLTTFIVVIVMLNGIQIDQKEQIICVRTSRQIVEVYLPNYAPIKTNDTLSLQLVNNIGITGRIENIRHEPLALVAKLQIPNETTCQRAFAGNTLCTGYWHKSRVPLVKLIFAKWTRML